MSKIIQLTAENVKRLHAVTITPNGHLVVVGGKNAQGKSSVLDAIAMALGGADEVPAMPVRRGEDKASVILDLGDIVVRRNFSVKEGGATTSTLIVENKDKMRANSPQAMLDTLTGKVTFDPLAFINMEPDQQAATLKRLVGLDLSALDAQRAKIYGERTLVNRDLDREQARVAMLPEHKDAPAEETSVADILAERDAALVHNAQRETLTHKASTAARLFEDSKNHRDRLAGEINDLEQRLATLRTQLEGVAGKLPELKQSYDAARAALDAFQPRDLSPINAKLANAELVNRKVRENKARATAAQAVSTIRAKSESLTKQIDGIDKEKDAKLAAVKFPIAGLAFTADGAVAFNGLPFDQASQAERMRVSVAIAAAMNPKLRVMLVRDASLLDEEGLTQLAKLAEEFDLQVWAERVGHGAECSVIIEDGAVKGAAVPAQEGAAA